MHTRTHLVTVSLGALCMVLGSCGADSRAKTTSAVAHMKAIMVASVRYAAEHENKLPPTLGTLVKAGAIGPEQLLDPRLDTTPMNPPAPNADLSQIEAEVMAHCDYIYGGGGRQDSMDGFDIMLYDKGQSPDHVRLVGYFPAEVEAVSYPKVLA